MLNSPGCDSPGRERVALVLSAGGMFGAYQAGAWHVLEKAVRPDIVVGASAGALNGWAIAGGKSAEAVAAHWRDPATREILRFRPGARWWNLWHLPAMFEVQALRDHAARVFAESSPVIDYGLALTRLPDYKVCLFRGPEITVEHLYGTAAIPACFPPARIGGRRYTDGGLIEKLPIRGALEMGATRIVAVDCLKLDAPVVRAGMNAWRALRRGGAPAREVPTTLIEPAAPLGNLKAAIFWERDNIERWMEQGARDAECAIAALDFARPEPASTHRQ